MTNSPRWLSAPAARSVNGQQADAHGKNLSLLHPTAGMVTLALLYDTVPTAMWPRLGDRAAMTINSKSALAAVTLDDIVAEAARWSLAASTARDAATGAAEALLAAVDSVEAPEDLAAMIRSRARALLLS
jgi:serine/threonine protein kinase HipA of HipAB toxin-antitoxin module